MAQSSKLTHIFIPYFVARYEEKPISKTQTKKSQFRAKKAKNVPIPWLFSLETGFFSSSSSKLAFLDTVQRYMYIIFVFLPYLSQIMILFELMINFRKTGFSLFVISKVRRQKLYTYIVARYQEKPI